MVVFTCNHCGDTLHKPKVEKHYQFQCRNYKSVTCVDCFKDFKNEEYVVHTKCITEDERYAAKGTYKNGIVKKGDVKQESWLEMIKAICNTEKNLKPTIRQLLETISEYSNVPRKKPKFLNFIKSSSGHRANMKEVEEVWEIIEKYKVNAKNGTGGQVQKQSQEGKKDNAKKRPNENNAEGSKKRKKVSEATLQQDGESNQTEERTTSIPQTDEKSTKFDYKAKIMEILSEKQVISHKKLEKKIIKAHFSVTGQNGHEENIIKKMKKKLKTIPNIYIEDNKVSLIL